MFASTEPTAGTDSLALLARQLERGPKACGAASSALYPVVRSLEVAGLLESHVEPSSSGPPRRYCHITPQGRAVRARWAQAWRDTRCQTAATPVLAVIGVVLLFAMRHQAHGIGRLHGTMAEHLLVRL